MKKQIYCNEKTLVSAIALQAVKDLSVLYRKCKILNEAYDEGLLDQYVEKIMERTITRAKNDERVAVTIVNDIRFTYDEMTALDFFNIDEDANDKHNIIMGIIGITEFPREIVNKKEYIEQTISSGIKDELNSAVSKARRKLTDKYSA